jgi:TetR/AcrR family transcriptional regulator, transcriptional repressor for nem operon
MSAPARRVGAVTSKKRNELLDCVERLMLREGYAAVTYRAVATKAGVTAGLVQYYFPTLDDLFVAAIRRRSDQNVRRLSAALAARPDEPLRVLWDYSQEESTAALTVEFLALGNHRKSIAAEIADVSEQIRRLQIDAIDLHVPADGVDLTGLSPDALLFLVTGVPKLIRLEEGVGLTSTHDEVVRFFEAYFDGSTPKKTGRRRQVGAADQRRTK